MNRLEDKTIDAKIAIADFDGGAMRHLGSGHGQLCQQLPPDYEKRIVRNVATAHKNRQQEPTYLLNFTGTY